MADHADIDHTGLTGVGGSVATDAIFDAKGDLAVGTGANTAAKQTVGANDTILMADSAQSTGVKWVASQTPSTQAFGDSASEGTADTYARGDHKHAMPSSPASGDRLLGYVADTAGNRSITSATLADIPTASIEVTFTAPASGKVLVVLSATCGATSTANALQTWGLRESTSIIAGNTSSSFAVRQPAGSSEMFIGATKKFYLSGVSGGSHTYKWAAANSTSGGTLIANSDSPAIMEIYDAT